MFWKFSRGLLYGLKTLWCFFPTTGSCLGAGLREDREAECCAGRLGAVAITPRTPSHLAVALHWMFSNWTKTLLKILYAERNGLALLTASKPSSQRSVEFCHCAVLLIIYARRGEDVHLVTEWTRGSEPFCSAAWAHCAQQLGQREGRNPWKVRSQEASTPLLAGCETLSPSLMALTLSTCEMEIRIAPASQGCCDTQVR